MSKITFTDNSGQEIYNIHATLKISFDVESVVAQLLEDNRSAGDIKITLDDVVESIFDTLKRVAHLAECNGNGVVAAQLINDNNWRVYQ